MNVAIIGAGSMAFTPALLAGFSRDSRYAGMTLGLVDVDASALDLTASLARQVSEAFGLRWSIRASTNRREVLAGADVVTAAIGVGGLDAWQTDIDIPARYGFVQPAGESTGPGGLMRALRHVPVLVGIGRDMEELCPKGTFYNFTNPLTVNTQAISSLSGIRCIGLCIGPDLTWTHLCRVMGVDKERTTAVIGGINHFHWVLDLRIDGDDAFPVLTAALDEMEGNPEGMQRISSQYAALEKRPQQPFKGVEPVCTALYRALDFYPGPGDQHVAEFVPAFMPLLRSHRPDIDGASLRACRKRYPLLIARMRDIVERRAPIEEEIFGKEVAWEHTQLLDIIASEQDNSGRAFHVNIPNRGAIANLPDGVVVEVPATVDRGGIHPFALGDLPRSILPPIAHRCANLPLIIEAAMEGSRRKAVQALINDPYCTDLAAARRLVNELIDAELPLLPAFQ